MVTSLNGYLVNLFSKLGPNFHPIIWSHCNETKRFKSEIAEKKVLEDAGDIFLVSHRNSLVLRLGRVTGLEGLTFTAIVGTS